MTVIMVKTVILEFGPLTRISFQLARKCQGPSSLICIRTWSIKVVSRVKLMNLPVGGLERLSSHRSLILAIFRPLFCRASFCLSLFLGLSSQANNASSAFMYLVAL